VSRPGPRVLVISAEPVGPRMAGPAIRARELAGALAGDCAVTLAAPSPSALDDDRVTLVEAGMADYDTLLGAIRAHDVVVAQLLPPRLLARVWRLPVRRVVDLYNPTVVEVLEAGAGRAPVMRERRRRVATRAAAAHLAAADFVLCASERQRDLWLGGMALRELLAVEMLDADPDLSGFLAAVPFGVPAEPPRPAPADGLRATLPAIGPEDRVLLWGGGIWDWLDAPTAIRAAALLADHEPAVHLVFLGVRRPALAAADEHRATAEAIALARTLGLEGRRVHFHDGWVPYGERGAWLLEADVGVSAHRAHLEARFAYRTRIVDYLWAGLPVVATGGDALGDLVGERQLGHAVPPGDAAAFAAACARLLDDGAARERARAAVAAAADELRWDRVVAPLVDFCLHGAKRPVGRARRRAVAAATLSQYPAIARETLASDGSGALAVKLARNATRAVREAARRPSRR
jgi:glycosyltransferase involved in cell wall biosynthesis